MTEVYRISSNLREAERMLQDAAERLRRGQLVAFPTETVYGLGANALDADAVQRIFAAKGRPTNNPLIVHVFDQSRVSEVADTWPDAAERLADRFWPGPLTLVLPKNQKLPPVVTAHGPTVAVRSPAHPLARRLLELARIPIAAPSANRSGEISPTTAQHVWESLHGRIDVIIDGGATAIGLESTVLSLVDNPPRLLRPGHISPLQIEELIGPIQRTTIVPSSTPLPSPGLMARHYAPRTRLELLEEADFNRVREMLNSQLRIGWITFGDVKEEKNLVVRRLPRNAHDYAARLYSVLHDLDALGLDRIFVDLPPATDDWLAVRDRLLRASSSD